MGLVGLLELVLVLASLMLKLNQNPCLVFTSVSGFFLCGFLERRRRRE